MSISQPIAHGPLCNLCKRPFRHRIQRGRLWLCCDCALRVDRGEPPDALALQPSEPLRVHPLQLALKLDDARGKRKTVA